MNNNLSTKLSVMYELMRKYNSVIIGNVKENLICTKCEKLLIDSCQIGCGCKFCRDCLFLLLENDIKHCPGITEYCEYMDLLEFSVDFASNMEISKLNVKCPGAICNYQCELIKMFEHFRLCENKSKSCPLEEYGCTSEQKNIDKINEHIQINSYDHIKLLTDILGNLRNEITEMKISDEENKNVIESLKINFQKELKQIEIDTAGKIKTNEVFLENLKFEIGSINLHFNKFKMEILSILDKTKQENQIQQENSADILNYHISEIKSQIKTSFEKIEEKLIDTFKELFCKSETKSDYCLKEFDERVVKLENNLEKQFNGIFQWKIDEIDNRYEVDGWILSKYFYGRMNPYKMQLAFLKHENGWRFRLRVYSSQIDRELNWPFREKITLRITNESSKKTCEKLLTNYEIDKPVNNPYNISWPLEFTKTELLSSELWESKWFIVECLVG